MCTCVDFFIAVSEPMPCNEDILRIGNLHLMDIYFEAWPF